MLTLSYKHTSNNTKDPIISAPENSEKHTVAESAWLVARPLLEYQHAFDLCGLHANAAKGRIGIIAKRECDAADVLKRCAGLSAQRLDLDVEQRLTSGAIADSDENVFETFRTLIWITTDDSVAEETVTQLGQKLTNDGQLLVLCSGSMARVLRRKTQGTAARHLQSYLERAGLQITSRLGFYGPPSIVWGALSTVSARLKRDDLADRYHFHMRSTYVVEGWQSSFAPLVLLIAKRSDHR